MNEYLSVAGLIEQLQRLHPGEITDVVSIRRSSKPGSFCRVILTVPSGLSESDVEELEARARTARRKSDQMEVRIYNRQKRLTSLNIAIAQKTLPLP